MSSSWPVLVLLLAGTVCHAQMPWRWHNSLAPQGEKAKTLRFARDGKTHYRVVIPEGATDAERKAAAIISTRFEQISGAEFPVVTEGAGFGVTGCEVSIGNTQLLRNSGKAVGELGKEGYAIAVHGDTLFISGGGLRGVINGAYSLLEEDMGCRWYSSTSDDVPQRARFRLAPVPRTVLPALDIRDPYYVEAWDTNWSLRNKTNAPNATIPEAWGGNSKYALFVHTYWHFFSPDLLFKDHPTYFAEVNGKRQPTQLCVTNPEVIRGAVEKCRSVLKDSPGATIISISPNDGRGYCECANCSAIDIPEGGKAGSMLSFVNIIADALEDEFPGVTFMALAYLDTFQPPKTIRPHRNVAIQLCTDSHAWKYQFCRVAESKDFQSALKAWAAIGARVYIWDYTVDFVHYLVPMANLPVVQPNLRFYIDNNARGVMLQGDYMANGSDMSDMRVWVWAKQLWNPDLPTKPLMKDFVFGFYKESADPIWKYTMMVWDFWEKYHALPHHCGEPSENPILKNLHCSYAPDGPMFTPAFMTNAWEYLQEAERRARSEEICARVRKVKASILYLRLAQGLGYYTESGQFSAGRDVQTSPGRRVSMKEEYLRLYDELMAICAEAGISAFSEQNAQSKITDKWHALLTVTPVASISLANAWRFVTDPQDLGQKGDWARNPAYYEAPAPSAPAAAPPNPGTVAVAEVRSDTGTGWESQGFAGYLGNAWYFQSLTLPEKAAEARFLYLFFGAVDEEAWVYINGELVFEHSTASTKQPVTVLWNQPFVFDAKRFLKPGAANQIAVRVYNGVGMGGLIRPVLLFPAEREYTAAELDP